VRWTGERCFRSGNPLMPRDSASGLRLCHRFQRTSACTLRALPEQEFGNLGPGVFAEPLRAMEAKSGESGRQFFAVFHGLSPHGRDHPLWRRSGSSVVLQTKTGGANERPSSKVLDSGVRLVRRRSMPADAVTLFLASRFLGRRLFRGGLLLCYGWLLRCHFLLCCWHVLSPSQVLTTTTLHRRV